MFTLGLHSFSSSSPILYLCIYLFFIAFSMFFVVSLLRMDVLLFWNKQSPKRNVPKYFPQILWFLDTVSFSFAHVSLFYSAHLICLFSYFLIHLSLCSITTNHCCELAVSPDINMPDSVHVEESLLCLFHLSLDLLRINGLCVSQCAPH